MTVAEVTAQALAEVALTRDEYELAVSKLGRHPNHLELGIIGALWSEHCGYKTSKPLLKRLPTSGPGVLQGPGENAGAIDIGDGYAAVFKIESHNHPSAIEPYQGAATGVGGILRDIFTMGARPVALLDSLRFGPYHEPAQRHLFDGVVAGIGGYGNCIGVPTVGGEVYFDESYRENCLVNAMCVGVLQHKALTRAVAAGIGNAVLLVGADTGRDGIHGATFASVELSEASSERRPAVQVGNPFLEKCLMEACLELAGDARIVAMQDLGAAGLTSSAAELAHRGGCGIELHVDRVARRERGMTPYEVMLSESQERMLIVVAPADVAWAQQAFAKWDLHSDVIGVITDTGLIDIHDDGVAAGSLPLAMLIDEVPLRHSGAQRPRDLDRLLKRNPLDVAAPLSLNDALLRLLGSPNIGSRRAVFRRYDHQVGDDTVIPPGGDAALVRVRGTRGAIALSTDGNARYAALDPRRGAAIAVAEAARNVAATGARPLAVTNCLNFGNPEKPEVYWQLSEAIDGIAEACRALDTPVVSGNVSLYNDTNGISIDPTAVIGMVGHIDDVENRVGMGFTSDGDMVALVGPASAELGGSEYQRLLHGVNEGPRPALDLATEKRVIDFVVEAAAQRLLHSCHDVADGGVAVALAECCIAGDRGVRAALADVAGDLEVRGAARDAALLFGEGQSRFVVSFAKDQTVQVTQLADRHGVRLAGLGTAGGEVIRIEPALDVPLVTARDAWERALE